MPAMKMKKTYITTMPHHIGAFLKASECLAKLNINITRVSYNKAIDSHTLFIKTRPTLAQLLEQEAKLDLAALEEQALADIMDLKVGM